MKRWVPRMLFESRLGDSFLAWLEARLGLAVVRVGDLLSFYPNHKSPSITGREREAKWN